MGRKSTVYDVYLNAVKEREYNFYMDMLKSEKYTDFVKSMVDAAKEGKEGATFTFDSGDSPDEIRKNGCLLNISLSLLNISLSIRLDFVIINIIVCRQTTQT